MGITLSTNTLNVNPSHCSFGGSGSSGRSGGGVWISLPSAISKRSGEDDDLGAADEDNDFFSID